MFLLGVVRSPAFVQKVEQRAVRSATLFHGLTEFPAEEEGLPFKDERIIHH